jgi:hypothetical protein
MVMHPREFKGFVAYVVLIALCLPSAAKAAHDDADAAAYLESVAKAEKEKSRPLANARSANTTPTEPVDPKIQRREDLKTALEDGHKKDSLAELLKDEDLKRILDGDEKKKKDTDKNEAKDAQEKDKALADYFGLEPDGPEIAKLKALHLSEKRFDDFAKQIERIDKAQEARTPYDKALLAQAEKLAEKHKSAIEIWQEKGGQKAGNLALKLERWEQAFASNDKAKAEQAGREVAGLMVSVADRAGLQNALAEAATKDKSPLAKNMAWAASNAASNATVPQAQLVLAASGEDTSAEFTKAFSKRWTEMRKYSAEFARRKEEVFEHETDGKRVLKDGRPVVNAERLQNLKNDYKSFTPDWAKATGDKDNIWLSAYQPESKTWSYTPSRDMVTEGKNEFKAPTIKARNPESLDQFFKAHGEGNQRMTLAAYSRQKADERANDGLALTDDRSKAKQVADVVDAIGRIPANTAKILDDSVTNVGTVEERILGSPRISTSLKTITKPVTTRLSAIEEGLNNQAYYRLNNTVAEAIRESRRRSLDLDAMYPESDRKPAAVETTGSAQTNSAARGEKTAPVRARQSAQETEVGGPPANVPTRASTPAVINSQTRTSTPDNARSASATTPAQQPKLSVPSTPGTSSLNLQSDLVWDSTTGTWTYSAIGQPAQCLNGSCGEPIQCTDGSCGQ